MSFDPKCFELAKVFIADLEAEKNVVVPIRIVNQLAQTIQDTIEDFLQDDDNFPASEPMFDTRRERDEWRHEGAEQQRVSK
jgi:hypothetical protein